jgi:hypothetical protein
MPVDLGDYYMACMINIKIIYSEHGQKSYGFNKSQVYDINKMDGNHQNDHFLTYNNSLMLYLIILIKKVSCPNKASPFINTINSFL